MQSISSMSPMACPPPPPPGLEHLQGAHTAATPSLVEDPRWQESLRLLQDGLQFHLASVGGPRQPDSHGHTAKDDVVPTGKNAESNRTAADPSTPTTTPASSVDSDCTSNSSDDQTAPAERFDWCTRQLTIEYENPQNVKVFWPVDARKIQGMDKQVVSPSFQVRPSVPFRLMIKPKIAGDKKGQANFKMASGRGYCELKCEAEAEALSKMPAMSFRLSIGCGARRQAWRGPVAHDFNDNTVGRLPSGVAEWNFSSAVEKDSTAFLVCLEITFQS